MSVDTAFLHDFCTRWLEAWNSHDTDRVLALLHPDIQWDDRTFWTSVLQGHQSMRTYIDKIWTAMPDVLYEETERFFAPDKMRALVLFRHRGSAPAKLGAPGTFDTHGCDIFLEFKDGKLSKYLASYDIVEMMCQLGALPPRGEKIGGAYLLSLRGNRPKATAENASAA